MHLNGIFNNFVKSLIVKLISHLFLKAKLEYFLLLYVLKTSIDNESKFSSQSEDTFKILQTAQARKPGKKESYLCICNWDKYAAVKDHSFHFSPLLHNLYNLKHRILMVKSWLRKLHKTKTLILSIRIN